MMDNYKFSNIIRAAVTVVTGRSWIMLVPDWLIYLFILTYIEYILLKSVIMNKNRIKDFFICNRFCEEAVL